MAGVKNLRWHLSQPAIAGTCSASSWFIFPFQFGTENTVLSCGRNFSPEHRFVFLTAKSSEREKDIRKQFRLQPTRQPNGAHRERSSYVSSCRQSQPSSSPLVLLDDREEEIADDRRIGISKLRTDVPRSICVGALLLRSSLLHALPSYLRTMKLRSAMQLKRLVVPVPGHHAFCAHGAARFQRASSADLGSTYVVHGTVLPRYLIAF